MQSCVCVMETPHGIDTVVVTRWWTKLTNKDFQHSITALGVGVCKVNPILPDVNEQPSLYIRSLPNKLLKYFSMITLTRLLLKRILTTSNVNYIVTE